MPGLILTNPQKETLRIQIGQAEQLLEHQENHDVLRAGRRSTDRARRTDRIGVGFCLHQLFYSKDTLGVFPFPLPFVSDPESLAVPLVLASAILAFLPVSLRFCIPSLPPWQDGGCVTVTFLIWFYNHARGETSIPFLVSKKTIWTLSHKT